MSDGDTLDLPANAPLPSEASVEVAGTEEVQPGEPERAVEPGAPQEAQTASTNADAAKSGPPEHTVEPAGNQAKATPKPESGVDARIRRRLTAVHGLLAEKEAFQLTYVFDKVPKPYYVRWKLEGNEAFSLLVGLKKRQARIRERARKKKAAA